MDRLSQNWREDTETYKSVNIYKLNYDWFDIFG